MNNLSINQELTKKPKSAVKIKLRKFFTKFGINEKSKKYFIKAVVI